MTAVLICTLMLYREQRYGMDSKFLNEISSKLH